MTDSKILVVDDEPTIVSGCKMILAEQGYQVQTCLSGREGLKKLQTTPFDLVLLDIQFPNISGIDILKILGGISLLDHGLHTPLTRRQDNRHIETWYCGFDEFNNRGHRDH